jgi:GMP synthase-like glutamine amidotransferase
MLPLIVLAMGVSCLVLLPPVGLAGPPARSDQTLPIQNDRFAAGDKPGQPVMDWTFESIKVDAGTGRVTVGPKGDAALVVPEDGEGVVLQGSGDAARGDLTSAPFRMKPFRWVKVGIEYTIESGEPLLFVSLRPVKERSLVDLEFVPRTEPGEKRQAFVNLHSGALKGKYSISVSLMGKGSARVFRIEATEEGRYPRPDKPALVITLAHGRSKSKTPEGWEEVHKLVKVYGFPSIKFVSYQDITEKKLKAVDPALVLLPAFIDSSEDLDRQKIMQATQTVAAYDAPLLGVGLGHQLLAMAHGVELDREPEFGPTRHEVVAEDPIFAGLPRSYFLALESHNGIVRTAPENAEIIAASEKVLTQVFRYPGKPWYTFQANLDKGWEYGCPEACLVWKNVLRQWGLVPPVETP